MFIIKLNYFYQKCILARVNHEHGLILKYSRSTSIFINTINTSFHYIIESPDNFGNYSATFSSIWKSERIHSRLQYFENILMICKDSEYQ